jgi:hypothetical protein
VHNIATRLNIVVLLLLLLASTTYALEATVEDLIIPVSYEGLDNNQREKDINHQLRLKTTEAQNFTFEAVDIATNYQLTLNQNSLEIGTDERTLSFTLQVPTNVDQGLTGTVAKIKATAEDGTETLFELKTDVASMILVDRILVKRNGGDHKNFDDDGEKIRDLQPGDQIEMRFRLENKFHDDYDYGDIEGTIRIELDDSDFDDDVDEEDDFAIDSGERMPTSEEVVLSFDIPQTAEENDYTLSIRIEGEDENGARYETNWEVTLEVERRRDDLRVTNLQVSPQELSCSRTATVTGSVNNIGSNRQSHTVFALVNQNLRINERLNMDLASGTSNRNSQSFQIPIDLKNAQPGTYELEARAFYDFTVPIDRKTASITVTACQTDSEPTPPPANQGTQESPTAPADATEPNVSGTQEPVPTVTGTAVIQTVEDPYTMEDIIVALIIVAIVFVLAMIMILFIKLMR